ncbi:MAG: M15 family metallopeptidase [Endomicrobium sp.]|jgi:D-alanyl-D-alanine dipeptidase|nr:M15 family metallopeptidase [Endomicrobium sp.]
MKKTVLLFLITLLTCGYAFADKIETATGLKKLEGERFITDMKYNSEDNFLKKNVYKDFGIDSVYVHKEVYDKLKALEPVLKEKKLKLVIFDAYRPLEVQKAMWEILPDGRYVANPKTGSLHNRGTAIDVALAYEDGKYLEFPTEFDSFEAKAAHTYVCAPEERYKCENRDLLKSLMESTGLTALRTEWWHYQLPNAKQYPILSVYKEEPANEK